MTTIYHSNLNSNGNTATSEISIEEANNKVRKMTKGNCYNCNNCNNCNKCNNCNNCYNCDSCNNCYNCDSCDDCDDCDNCYNCDNCDTQPIQIIGFNWIITIRANKTMKIGCQDHSWEFWRSVHDETVVKMDENALEFWNKNKKSILAFLVN